MSRKYTIQGTLKYDVYQVVDTEVEADSIDEALDLVMEAEYPFPAYIDVDNVEWLDCGPYICSDEDDEDEGEKT